MNTETNTPNPVGAPVKEVKFPGNVFTIGSLVNKNPSICALTIRKRVNDGLASAELTKLAIKVDKGRKAGRPIFRFMLTTRVEANKASLVKANAKNKENKVKDVDAELVGGVAA